MQGSIIGGGIGGLVTALAFQQQGLLAKVYEAAPAASPQGAGLVLAANGMQVLQRLQLADAVIARGHRIDRVLLTNEHLSPLSETHVPEENARGNINLAIHRSDLQAVLLEHLPKGSLEWGRKCIRLESDGSRTKLHFEGEDPAYADYTVAADGLQSVSRKQLFPQQVIRDVQQICWRGVVAFDLPAHYEHQAIEAWGRGKRFGFTRINPDFIYWFAVLNKHGNAFDFRADLKSELHKQFQSFAPLVAAMIEDTAPARIVRRDLSDLKPLASWHTDRVCLLGDAAHATTPNMGQGACQAMIDGWTLAQLLNESKNPQWAFRKYQKIRKPTTDFVCRWSYRLGEVAHLENPLLTTLRNAAIKRLPASFTRRRMNRLFQSPLDL